MHVANEDDSEQHSNHACNRQSHPSASEHNSPAYFPKNNWIGTRELAGCVSCGQPRIVLRRSQPPPAVSRPDRCQRARRVSLQTRMLASYKFRMCSKRWLRGTLGQQQMISNGTERFHIALARHRDPNDKVWIRATQVRELCLNALRVASCGRIACMAAPDTAYRDGGKCRSVFPIFPRGSAVY